MTARAGWAPALDHTHSVAPARRVFLDALDAVAEAHLVTAEELLGRSRTDDIAAARRDLVRRCRAAGLSASYIARALGCDHTTILALAGRRASAGARVTPEARQPPTERPRRARDEGERR